MAQEMQEVVTCVPCTAPRAFESLVSSASGCLDAHMHVHIHIQKVTSNEIALTAAFSRVRSILKLGIAVVMISPMVTSNNNLDILAT